MKKNLPPYCTVRKAFSHEQGASATAIQHEDTDSYCLKPSGNSASKTRIQQEQEDKARGTVQIETQLKQQHKSVQFCQ